MFITLNKAITIPDIMLKLSNTMPKSLAPKVRFMLRPDGKQLAILTERRGTYTLLNFNLIPNSNYVEGIFTLAISIDSKMIDEANSIDVNDDINRFCKVLWDKIRDTLRDNVTLPKVKPIIKYEFPNDFKLNNPDIDVLMNKYNQNLDRYKNPL